MSGGLNHPAGPCYGQDPPDEQDLADEAWAELDRQWRGYYSDLFDVCREILDSEICTFCGCIEPEPHKDGVLCARLDAAMDVLPAHRGPDQEASAAPTPATAPEAGEEG